MNADFVELLQVSLDTREELTRSLSDAEWDKVYTIAKNHGMSGVILGGLEKLCVEQRPNMPILMRWIGHAECVRAQNSLINAKCAEITTKLAKDGFLSCVLKGQANAVNYPKPELRSPGDIDIWVTPANSKNFYDDRRKIAEYVISHEDEYIRMQYHHIDFHLFSEVNVEVHFCPMILFNYKKNALLQNKFSEEKDFCFKNWNADNTFCTLTYMPNVLMQLVHMYRHLFDGGIGLKQIVDFYYLLVDIYRNQGNIAYPQLRKDIEDIGLEDFCGGVCYVIHSLLLNGRRGSFLLMEPNEKHGRLLLEELSKWGEKSDPSKLSEDCLKIKTNGWFFKLYNFMRSITRNSRLWRYYPSDCVWNIIYRLAQYMWRKRNGWN